MSLSNSGRPSDYSAGRHQSDDFLELAVGQVRGHVEKQSAGATLARFRDSIRMAGIQINLSFLQYWCANPISLSLSIFSLGQRVSACERTLESLDKAVTQLASELQVPCDTIKQLKAIALDRGAETLCNDPAAVLGQSGVEDVRVLTWRGRKSLSKLLCQTIAAQIEGETLLINSQNFKAHCQPILSKHIPPHYLQYLRRVMDSGFALTPLVLSNQEEKSIIDFETTRLPDDLQAIFNKTAKPLALEAQAYSQTLERLYRMS